MRLTVLGSGVCSSDFGAPDRYPPGFLLDCNGFRILLDCSELIRMRITKAGYDFAALDLLCISHPHPDHNALPHFLLALYCKQEVWGKMGRREQVVLCPPFIAEHYEESIRLFTPDLLENHRPYPPVSFLTEERKRYVFEEGKVSVMMFPVSHAYGRCPSVAFRIEAFSKVLTYSGDSGRCDALREAAEGADLFLCEASSEVGLRESRYGHLTPRWAAEIAKEAGAKSLLLTHYSGLDSEDLMLSDARSSGYRGSISLAKDFATYEL